MHVEGTEVAMRETELLAYNCTKQLLHTAKVILLAICHTTLTTMMSPTAKIAANRGENSAFYTGCLKKLDHVLFITLAIYNCMDW